MTPAKFFATSKAFRTCLGAKAAAATELLVGFHKMGTGKRSMTWSESGDEALCFGWIDGVTKRIDDASYTVRFTPRKTTSIWSKVNIAKYHKLVAEGRMTPAGYKKIILHWITTAKRKETRATRLAKLMEASAAAERLRLVVVIELTRRWCGNHSCR
ncbi:MAG: YdeI/OmpD-associated family protein [Betaproteobacteria bacterium]|nr:YdeI/OmpD-associated family protein [Betaproteobacteria bacterium]